jgi:hypothetical protein
LLPRRFQPLILAPVLALAGSARRKFAANKLPFGRNLEHRNFTGCGGNSQGDSQFAQVIYHTYFQWFTAHLTARTGEIFRVFRTREYADPIAWTTRKILRELTFFSRALVRCAWA